MTKFKTLKEFEDYKENAMFCLCKRLMTGLHMTSCNRLKKEEERIKKRVMKNE